MNERILKALYKIADAASGVDSITRNLELKRELGVGSLKQPVPAAGKPSVSVPPATPQDVQNANDARVRRLTPQLWNAMPRGTRARYAQRNVLPPHLTKG